MTRGNTQRHATITVVELSDVKRWLRAHQALVRAVAADGNITEDEVTTLTENIRRGSVEIDEAMLAAERADIAELIVLGNRKEHGPSPELIRRAGELGMRVAVLLPEPTPLFSEDSPEAA